MSGANQGAQDPKPPRIVVGSGWWSSERAFSDEFPDRKELGDAMIRSVPFFELWLESVTSSVAASEIVVVDSAAPLKPAPELRDKVRWIELPFNARHSTNHVGGWSGWTRSVLVSGNYALASDCEFFVYVEQGCLLKGDGLAEACIAAMTADHMFGSGAGTPQPLQQSLFVVRGAALSRFLGNLAKLKYRDCDMAPEWKFVWATSATLTWLANIGIFQSKLTRKIGFKLARLSGALCFLPFGSGRARPIPFDAPHCYFQHGTSAEIARYRRSDA
ncbi:hypothetical protein Dshi_2863 [Dinoroseobacter shibae DFL 12 = DSM 16493]|jgi:hypothetical protein|uniref:Glycosyltransferase n=1 Tax=Dinoroseobacter shibae (strain DSM 16493 / NCIMB 14021 / DFL 12) TaxID=398580 RepID=A8LJJ3_DINSH|nr:hypothetical protein [Dinoroseobacter shibae]ABV94596.1 hypothetical protein Dshi_2863 [Dinoroseobacter shibae DFL 12 = DSM 16493]URF46023.1 hypothetical protein M8008_14755 [Dinoroseobacter shibae]URF50329.1 hypothetical protein M8007_14755 [Dinoroseobacter shibae]